MLAAASGQETWVVVLVASVAVVVIFVVMIFAALQWSRWRVFGNGRWPEEGRPAPRARPKGNGRHTPDSPQPPE